MEKEPPTALVSCCNSFLLNCFMFHASMVVQSTFTSFESSLFFNLKGLGLSLPSALVQRVYGRSFCGRASFFRFQFRSTLSFFRNWRRDSILCPFRKNARNNVVHSSPRPRCLGWYIILIILVGIDKYKYCNLNLYRL